MNRPQVSWPASPVRPTLAHGEVHVWCVALADVGPELAGTLSPAERDRAARLRFEADRRRYLASHGALRAILGGYLGVEPGAVSYAFTELGKPSLASGGPAFNLAHAGDLALVAVSLMPEVGVDLEPDRPIANLEAIGDRFVSDTEQRRLQSLQPAQRARAILECWTRWEAYLKARGLGVAGLDDAGARDVWPGGPTADGELIRTDLAPWVLYHLTPAPNYVGAVAVPGRATLRTFSWAPSVAIAPPVGRPSLR